MSADKNYEEILEDISAKLKNIESIKQIDILDIKDSVEAIGNSLTDSQSKMNFEAIREKLDNIAFQVDNCNEALAKDLKDDLDHLKEVSESVGQHIENLQNVQNLALTSAEFGEFQKQQLDLAVKSNENVFEELAKIKDETQTGRAEGIKLLEGHLTNILSQLDKIKVDSKYEGAKGIENLASQIETIHLALAEHLEKISEKVNLLPEIDAVGSVVSDFSSVQQKSIKQTSAIVKSVLERVSLIEDEINGKDFQNQLAKISEIYDSLSIIRNWIDEVGDLNKSIDNVYSRLGENIDFDDLAEKVNVLYENIGVLSNWTEKFSNMDVSMASAQEKISSLSGCIEDTKNICKVVSSLKDNFNEIFTENVDLDDLSNKMDIVYENLTSLNEWGAKVDVIGEKISNISSVFGEDDITSKVDIVYENISLLNEWVSKIDSVAETNRNIEQEVPYIKEKVEQLANDLNVLIHATKDGDDSYIYTLLDIESDFLKLHKFVDDRANVTSENIDDLKEKFTQLNDDISSISLRTNKLILSADDANKEFKTYLDSFKNTVNEFIKLKQKYNSDEKIAIIEEKMLETFKLMQNALETTNNINNAFMYFAEWIDATGKMMNDMSANIAFLYEQKKNEHAGLLEASKDFATSEDISELKSLLTGIMVQLNTALTPDIDSLNDRVDSVSKENENKFSELETLLQETVIQQSKKITSLEEKINTLNDKFDKLINAMADETQNYEMKDILSYIATQVSATNEAIINQQNTADVVDAMAQKLGSFDENINKIVSYIEEE